MKTVQMDYDVVVIGGGTAGFPAALAAARQGRKTLIVERNSCLGGLAASGMPLLAFNDRQGNRAVGGIGDEVVSLLQQRGAAFGHVACPIHNSITPVNPDWLKIVASELCAKAGVDTLFSTCLTGTTVDNGKIVAVSLLSGSVAYQVSCKVLIDASGDAVAAYLAGAEYEVGDEEGKIQPVSLIFTLGNVNLDVFMDYVKAHPETFKLPDTYGVHYTMEYFLDSPTYYFTGFGEFIEQAKADGKFDIPRDRVIFAKQPSKNEIVVNASRILDIDPTDPLSMSKAETEGYRQVGVLANFFKEYCPGFEDSYLADIATNTGARESRRIVGVKRLDRSCLDHLEIPEDSIALGGYNVDIHGGTGLYLMPNERAIGIPYGCLVSKSIDGLLVAGRCISVDPYVHGLTRIMSTCMAMGEAAGTAAALALEGEVSLADLDPQLLRDTLRRNGAVVSL